MESKTTQPKDYVCLECGKRLTLKQAERAMNGDKGCPKCGGSDIDLFVESRRDPNHLPMPHQQTMPDQRAEQLYRGAE